MTVINIATGKNIWMILHEWKSQCDYLVKWLLGTWFTLVGFKVRLSSQSSYVFHCWICTRMYKRIIYILTILSFIVGAEKRHLTRTEKRWVDNKVWFTYIRIKCRIKLRSQVSEWPVCITHSCVTDLVYSNGNSGSRSSTHNIYKYKSLLIARHYRLWSTERHSFL